jgi:hypothetical protein
VDPGFRFTHPGYLLHAVVPVDAMSSDEVFPELYTAWHLATAARISSKVTLTRIDMIAFGHRTR